MSVEQLGFDLEAGRAARDQALEAVNDPPWRAFAERAVYSVAKTYTSVTSDLVWQELDRMGIPRPAEGRALGPVMLAAVRDGVLTPSGFTSGTNPRHHGDVMRVYRSTLL